MHPGTGHAFMGPHNALGTLNAQLAARDLAERRLVSERKSGVARFAFRRLDPANTNVGVEKHTAGNIR